MLFILKRQFKGRLYIQRTALYFSWISKTRLLFVKVIEYRMSNVDWRMSKGCILSILKKDWAKLIYPSKFDLAAFDRLKPWACRREIVAGCGSIRAYACDLIWFISSSSSCSSSTPLYCFRFRGRRRRPGRLEHLWFYDIEMKFHTRCQDGGRFHASGL